RRHEAFAVFPGHAGKREAVALQEAGSRLRGTDTGRRLAQAVVKRMRYQAAAVGHIQQESTVRPRGGHDQQDPRLVHSPALHLVDVRDEVLARQFAAHFGVDALVVDPVEAAIGRLLFDFERHQPRLQRSGAKNKDGNTNEAGNRHDSSSSSARLRARPPAYPVRLPLAPMMRWQGTMTLSGLRPVAAPAARALPGWPARRASSL